MLVMGGAYVVSKSNVRPQTEPALSPGTGDKGGASRIEDYPIQAQESWVGRPDKRTASGIDAAGSTDSFSSGDAAALPRDRNALLLEAMKEELFQLEIDRQQRTITPEEYSKAKAALEETIRRALARSKSS